jgi:hypothetical protein
MTSNHSSLPAGGDLAVISSGEEEAGNAQDEIAVSCALPASSSPYWISIVSNKQPQFPALSTLLLSISG